VAIATPPATHAEIACKAMRQGKHILIEKPLDVTLENARRIIRTRDQTGKVAGIDYMMRFNPLVETLTLLTRSGCFGRLHRAMVENYAQDEILPPEHWFWDRDQSGGIFVEHGVHFFDLVDSFATAAPCKVIGASHSRNSRQEDQITATVVYEDGLMATHYHAFSRPGFFEHNSLRLVYDLAEIDLEGWIPLSGRVQALVNDSTERDLYGLPGFQEVQKMAIKDLEDISRPKGWGDSPRTADRTGEIISGGRSYRVNNLITGTFAAGAAKGEVYAASLRGLLRDLIIRIEEPGHTMRASLEDGLRSLDTALQADRAAHEGGLPAQ